VLDNRCSRALLRAEQPGDLEDCTMMTVSDLYVDMRFWLHR
jgi:hypothetical protein